jgi:hypothetical protein
LITRPHNCYFDGCGFTNTKKEEHKKLSRATGKFLMSLPPELRVLCFQLSNTPTEDLPRLTPVLLQYVSRCQVPLSTPAGSAAGPDASSSSVLVHKLKTQLSTLLKGKTLEARFTAVLLIKAVVETGGWEILQASELRSQWIPGLLSILVVC